MHKDFIEWEYWSDVLHKTVLTVRNVKTLLQKVEETVGVRSQVKVLHVVGARLNFRERQRPRPWCRRTR